MDPDSSQQNQPSDDQESGVARDPGTVFTENPIIEVFNKPGNLRILVTLIQAAGAPMSVASISEQAKVDRQTFYNNEELLLDYGLIEKADKVGNAQRYRVDKENEAIQALQYLYDTMIDADQK